VIQGEAEPHHENLVLLNAGAGIYVAGQAGSIAEGVELARESLRSGAARRVLEQVIAYTRSKKLQPDPGPGPEQP
jgi:anthranilate phosphoribosyltransferase